jgi:hypothetical protein
MSEVEYKMTELEALENGRTISAVGYDLVAVQTYNLKINACLNDIKCLCQVSRETTHSSSLISGTKQRV